MDESNLQINPDGAEIYNNELQDRVKELAQHLMDAGLPYIICIQIEQRGNSGRVAGSAWTPDDCISMLHILEEIIQSGGQVPMLVQDQQDQKDAFYEKPLFVDHTKKGPVA